MYFYTKTHNIDILIKKKRFIIKNVKHPIVFVNLRATKQKHLSISTT